MSAMNADLEQRMRDQIAWLGQLCELALFVADLHSRRERPLLARQCPYACRQLFVRGFRHGDAVPLRGRA